MATEDGVATITLNRPHARNALDSATLRLLPALVAEADGDAAVDVLVLTGADPAFCAGLDLKQLGSTRANLGAGAGVAAGGDAGPGAASAGVGAVAGPGSSAGRSGAGVAAGGGGEDAEDGASVAGLWRGPLPPTVKPVIGAINGPAVTGGLELALACDFLVASERARFGDTHARVGVHPGWGLTVLLPEAVGMRRAREMSATGRLVDAATALTWGLVNHVVPHDELLLFCRSLADDIRSADPAVLHGMYETYGAVLDAATAGGWDAERAGTRRWRQGGGVRFDQVAERSGAIIRRGSAQL